MDTPPLLAHPFEPVYDAHSRLLILGSFPSVLSRQNSYYYGNPRNRFWAVLGRVLEDEALQDIPGRRAWLLRHRVALWDSLAACRISGSADASIGQAQPNDIARVLSAAPIRLIACNGQAAARHYAAYAEPLGLPTPTILPSTSPANAAWSLDRLVAAWSVIRQALDQ